MAYGKSSKEPPNSVSYSQIQGRFAARGDYRQRTLGFKYNFVGRNASYKKVTLTFCMAEQIEVLDVQQVKCAWSMSDAIHLRACTGRTEFPGSSRHNKPPQR